MSTVNKKRRRDPLMEEWEKKQDDGGDDGNEEMIMKMDFVADYLPPEIASMVVDWADSSLLNTVYIGDVRNGYEYKPCRVTIVTVKGVKMVVACRHNVVDIVPLLDTSYVIKRMKLHSEDINSMIQYLFLSGMQVRILGVMLNTNDPYPLVKHTQLVDTRGFKTQKINGFKAIAATSNDSTVYLAGRINDAFRVASYRVVTKVSTINTVVHTDSSAATEPTIVKKTTMELQQFGPYLPCPMPQTVMQLAATKDRVCALIYNHSNDNVLAILGVAETRCIPLFGPRDQYRSFAICNDRIVFVNKDGSITILDCLRGDGVVFSQRMFPFHCLDVGSDGESLAVVCRDNSIYHII